MSIELTVEDLGDERPDPVIEELKGPLAELSTAIVFGSLAIPEATFPRPVRLQWDGLEIQLTGGSIHLDGLTMVIEGAIPAADFDRSRKTREGLPTTLELEDESIVVGRGRPVSHTATFGEGPSEYRMTFHLFGWDWKPGAGTDFLLAVLEGIPKLLCDNLHVARGNPKVRYHSTSEHFRGQGHATWHILNTGKGHVAVVDRRGASPRQLRLDLRALSFVLGGNVEGSTFWKVDATGTVMGALDLARSATKDARRRFPILWGPTLRHCWMAPLFEAVAKALAKDKATATAIIAYLNTLSGSLHAAYLLGQVGLEKSCKEWHRPPRTTLVSSTAEWGKWVAKHATEIRAHAPTEEAKRILVEKAKHALIQGPSSDVVASAFASLGLDLGDDVLKEIALRNRAAHDYYMFDEDADDPDIQKQVDRLQVVQSLLATVVAIRSGYKGPLAGWTRREGGEAEPIPFWLGTDLPESLTYYDCIDPELPPMS